METVELIDYAYPMMMAERHLRAAHEALLNHGMATGLEELEQALVDVRTAIMSVKHMQEMRK
jgi:hypothetical protein